MPSWEFIPRPAAPGTAEYDGMSRFVVQQTPVDDVTTIVWYIQWHPTRPLPYEEARWSIWNDEYLRVIDEPLMGQDRAKMKAGHMTGINNLLTEDMIVAETMGPIADRTGEYLGSSDAAVARFRRIFLEAIHVQENGDEPRGCSGNEPYRRIAGVGVMHPATVDWRDLHQRSRQLMADHGRLPWFAPDELAPDARELYERIVGGPRTQVARAFPLTDDTGRLNGPFNAMLLSPAIGNALQELGAAIRYRSNLAGPRARNRDPRSLGAAPLFV